MKENVYFSNTFVVGGETNTEYDDDDESRFE